MPNDSAAPSPAPQTGQVADAVARAIAGEVPWEQSIGTYMSRKRRKQHEQYLAEPIAVGLQELGLPAPPADRDDSALFCGCVFWVNGYTNPPLSVLRPLITARGGLVDLSLMANTLGSSDRKNTITHIIATSMPTTKLAELRTALPMRARGAVVPAFVSRAVAGVQTNLLGGAASDIQRPSAPTNHPTASHVGADGDASSPVPRALRHVPIVLPEWVLASLSLGHLAPIEPFLVTPQVPKHAIPAPVGAAHALPAPAFPMRQRVEGVGLESDQGRDRVIHATTAGAAELSAREGAQTAATLPLLAHSAQGLDRQSLAEADKGEPKQKVWKPLQVQPERAENTAVAEQTEATDAQPLPVAAEPAAVSAEAGPGTGGTFRARAPAAAAYHSTSRLHLLGSWRSECYLPQTLPAILAARADAPPLLPAPPLPGQQTLPTEKAAGQAKQQGGVVLPPPLPLQTWALWRDLPALAPSPALSGKQRWRLSEAAATALGDPAVPYLVIHVDMDSFFVSAALAHRPELLDTTLLAHTGTARPRVCTMGEADHSTEAGDGDVVRVRVCGRPAAVSHGAHGVPASVTAASAAAASASSSESAVLTSFAPPAGWALASVASCTHPARSHGVHADMRLGTALRLCPSLAVVPYDFPAVRAAAAALHGELARVGDWVVPLSVDEGLVVASRKDAVEAFLDRADVEHFLDLAAPPCSDVSSTSLPLVSLSHIDAAASLWLCSLLHARVLASSRCPCSVGAGPSLFLAKTATGQAKPGGVRVVIPVGTDASFGENARSVGRVVWAGALEFLRPLPLSELPGLGRVGRKKINTILAAAAAAPAAAAAGAGDAKSAPDGTRSQDDSSDDDEEQEQKDGSWTCGALQDFIFQHNPALVAGSRPRSSFPQITTPPALTAAFGPAASLSLCHFALGFDSRKVETTFRLHDLAAVAGAAAAAAAGSSSSDTDAVAAAVAAAAAAAAGPPRSVSVDVTWGVRLSTPAHAHALLLQVAAQALTRLRGARAAAGRATLRLMVRAEGVVTDPKFMGHGRCEVFSKSVAFTTPLNPLSDPVSASTGGTDSAGADSFDPLTAAASSALASTDTDGAPDDAALRVHKVKPRSLRLIFSALLGLLQGPLKKPVQDIRGVSVILSNLTPASGATGAGAGQGVTAGGAGAGAAGTLEGFVKMQGALSLSSLKKKGDADSDDDDDILEVVSVTRQPASSAVAVDGTGGAKKRGRKRAAPASAPVSAFSAGTAQSKGPASPPRAPADAPSDPAPTVPAAAAPESDLMRQWVASAAAASAAAAAAAAELAAAEAAAAEAEAVVRGPEMSAGELLTLLQHQSHCPAAAGRCKLLSQAAQTQGKVCGRGCGARECSPCLAHAAASAAAAAAVGSAQIADAGDVLGRGVAARVHGLLGDHARLRGLSVREKTLLRTLLLLLRPSSTAIAGTTAAVVAAMTPSTMCPSSPLKPHTTDIPAEATVPSDVSSAPVSEPHQAASDETPEVLTPHPDAASAFVAELDAASQAIAPLGCDLGVVQARVSAFVSSLLRADFVFTPPNEGAFIAIPLVCMQSVAPASDPAPARASVFAWATISPSRWRNGLLWLASGAVHLCKSHRPSAAAAVARAVADAAGNGLVREGVLMVQGDVHAVAKWYPSASEGTQLSVAEMTDPPCSRYSTPADARRRFTNQVTNLLALANEILGQDVRDFQEQVGEAVRAVIEDE